ncbi:hypothetical protein BCR35DRAFT_355663 [Leucosporidium creatinivorum]|uniref:Shikimate dehydrogenase substrate binding N-terminal domain-containing protein n=1 Tax=Leucosporidium creatinivorum TaxID=106004 RepID=A0A1Y2DAA9_9BASI|nr:hypothetical protein BCR35DRAFT_355663 [Leucosporidium creatinivorum]
MSPFSEERPEVSPDDIRTQTALYGANIEGKSIMPKLLDIIFPAVGLPRYKFIAVNCDSLESEDSVWKRDMKLPTTLGSCITMPLKIQAMTAVDELTPQAHAIGSVNTTYFRSSSPSGSPTHVGTNLDTLAVSNVLLSTLTALPTPFPPNTPLAFAPGKASALMIGGGGATRAAIYAMHAIGLSPIYLVNRDAGETAAIVAQFGEWDLRPLETVEEAKEALAKGEKEGVRLAAGVGAIPSIEPKTEAEKRVYDIARLLFEHPDDASGAKAEEGFLALPSKPVFVEMAYHPPMTLIRTIAESAGWKTVCGTEVVAENAFEHCYIWTGKVVPPAVRDECRRVLREA